MPKKKPVAEIQAVGSAINSIPKEGVNIRGLPMPVMEQAAIMLKRFFEQAGVSAHLEINWRAGIKNDKATFKITSTPGSRDS